MIKYIRLEYGACSLSDLIKLRIKYNLPYSEMEILTFLLQVTKILSDLKKNNIC